MGKALTGVFGVIFGFIAGAAVGYVMYNNMGSGTNHRILGGAIAGALAGMFGGVIGGDFGKQEKGDSRTMLAVVIGGIVGAAAASQAHRFGAILTGLNVQGGL